MAHFRDKMCNFASEAEEETGSAEEQPASNRLPHYTEIVSGTVTMHGCAFSISVCAMDGVCMPMLMYSDFGK